jgi:hypothetical protein
MPGNGPIEPCKQGPAGLVLRLDQPSRDRGLDGRIPDQVHVLAKLVGPTTCSIFLRSGAETGIRLPEGTYAVRWAVGSKWKGVDELFGPDTSFFEANDPVKLTESYTIKLTLDAMAGNLGKSGIGRGQF